VDWHDHPGNGSAHPDHPGRNILTVEIAESYAARALECAESTARELAREQALDLSQIDLIIATASVPGFADALATRLGIPTTAVATLPDDLHSAHTAAPALALQSAELAAGSTTLFISAGAGITVTAALYLA